MATTEEQVSWNLSQRISEQIDSLLRGGRTNSINGRVLESFFMFKEIRLLINHHFDDEERKEVDKLEKQINDTSVEMKTTGLKEETDEFEYDYGSREKDLKKDLILLKNKNFLLVEKYRKTILRLLDEYGYLMERKKDASYMM